MDATRMDATQNLIYRELGVNNNYQLELNIQKRRGAVYGHIQLLCDASGHWLLTFCCNGRIQICDPEFWKRSCVM